VPPARKRPPGPFSFRSRLASLSEVGWYISKASVRFIGYFLAKAMAASGKAKIQSGGKEDITH
jgi:hypothetical protein